MGRFAIASVTLGALLTMTSLAIAHGSPSTPSPDAAPDGGAPLPNAGRPLTHDELLAVRGEHPIWAFQATTLVADATIVTDQAMRGPVCRPSEPNARMCAFGVLPRDGDQPGDPVIILRRKERTGMGVDGAGIGGRMAYVRFMKTLRLLGPVQSPSGTYLTPIEPAAMAGADSLPVGSMIVVRGWLSVLTQEEACPRVPPAFDGRRDGWDSPFVRCPGGWLTADEVVRVDPANPLVPAAFGIAVQFGALDRYGPGRSASPDLATFLLRRVENPLDGMEPHLGWKVVGRLDAPQGIPMPPPPSLEEAARPGGLEWRPVVSRQPPADSKEVFTTEWAGGFASVHRGVDRLLSSWVSADGVQWRAAELPTGITSVWTLLELRDGLVLIANVRFLEKSTRFEVWRSTDGLAWRRVSKQHLLTPRGFERVGRVLTGFGSLRDRVVFIDTFAKARGSKARSRSAAHDDEYPLEVGRQREEVTYAWTSRDGRSWRRQLATGLGRTTRDFEMVQGDGELLLLHERRPEMRQSKDGVHWRRIGTYPEELINNAPWVLTRVEGGFILAGEPSDGGFGEGNFLVVWRQADDGTWERAAERPSRMPTAAIAIGSTVIIAGDRFDFTSLDDPFDPTFVPFLLVSTDGGRTWDESLEWTDGARWCLSSLAEHDGSVLLDASCAPQDAATKYIYEAQESADARHVRSSELPSRSWAPPKEGPPG